MDDSKYLDFLQSMRATKIVNHNRELADLDQVIEREERLHIKDTTIHLAYKKRISDFPVTGKQKAHPEG